MDVNMLLRDSPVPIYHQLAVMLRRELQSGKFEPGQRYYSDTELKHRFSLSHLTVRQALRALVAEGLIERKRGSGSFVTERIREDGRPAELGEVLFAGWTQASLSAWDAMYFRDIYQGIEQETRARGFRLRIEEPDALTTVSGQSGDMLDHGLAGAIMLQSSADDEQIRKHVALGLRVVTVNFSADAIPSVYPDHAAGGRLAIEHLIALGHRRLAHLNSGEPTMHWREVLRAFAETATLAGIATADAPVIEADGTGGHIEAGAALTARLWNRRRHPTAIFSGNDLMAIGAIRYLMQRGVRVPEDVSVIGFDNIEAAEICSPPLTTVAVDRIGMGRQAVRLLLELPTMDDVQRQVRMPVSLMTRASTGAPRRDGKAGGARATP